MCKKGYFWNPVTCSCKDGKYVESIIEEMKVIPTKSNSTKTF